MSNPTIKAEHLAEYQNLQDDERALIALAADGSGTLSLTNNVGYWNAAGAFTTIFNPSAGASDPRLVASRDYAYFLDHTVADQKKWNIDTGLSKWGIDRPTVAPSVASSQTTTDTWQPLVTYTTFGLLRDNVGNIQWLQNANANSTNVGGTVGTSGKGSPPFATATGTTTTDGPITWTNRGPIGLWKPSTFYNYGRGTSGSLANPSILYDPNTQALFFNNLGTGGTSGTNYPGFVTTIGAITVDGQNKWEFLGFVADAASAPPGTIHQWTPSTGYTAYASSTNFTNTAVTTPASVPDAYNITTGTFDNTLYLQSSGNTATSSASFANPVWANTIGGMTTDNQLQWMCLGTATWMANTAVVQWAGAGIACTVVYDGANFQVCIQTGTTGGSTPTWQTAYGAQTNDGSAIWACLGQLTSWAATTKWFYPVGGFSAPTSTASFGGAGILDSNGNIERVIESGLSQTPGPPSWNPVGSTTTDGTITWFDVEMATASAGDITLIKGRQYFLVYTNTVSGNISDLSPVSISSGALTAGQIFVGNLQVSSDPQVNMKILLATTDGGDQTTLYFVAELPNTQLSYIDTTPEPILLAGNIYQETDSAGVDHGVADNDPPPNGSFPIKYRGRLYMLVGSFLFFSKSLSDVTTSTGIIAGRYEEDWPPDFQTDISEGAEVGRGLFTDGYVLYIGTQRHIRRITGDGPTNFTSPEVIFNEVGINNQDVWQPIFMEGTPAGSMWLTPDFRVIRSDFNTYQNAGELIQKTLNTINPAASNNCWASYLGQNGYNFYILAIPTGTNTEPDTLCVYNIKTGTWFIWTPADLLRCALYYLNLNGQPRFVVNSNDGSIYLFDPTVSMDRATGVDRVGITSTIRTVYSDMTDASTRKALNEIEIDTTQTNMSLTVEGATSDQEFVTPNVVITNGKLIQNIFGEYKLYLAGLKSQDRFYRVTLSDTSTNTSTVDDEILSYYSFEAIPLHRN